MQSSLYVTMVTILIRYRERRRRESEVREIVRKWPHREKRKPMKSRRIVAIVTAAVLCLPLQGRSIGRCLPRWQIHRWFFQRKRQYHRMEAVFIVPERMVRFLWFLTMVRWSRKYQNKENVILEVDFWRKECILEFVNWIAELWNRWCGSKNDCCTDRESGLLETG